MRSLSLISSLLYVLPLTRALVLSNDGYTLFEKLDRVPDGWIEEAEGPDPSDPITMRFHVKQQNVEAFEQKLLDVWRQQLAAKGSNDGRSLRLIIRSMATT